MDDDYDDDDDTTISYHYHLGTKILMTKNELHYVIVFLC